MIRVEALCQVLARLAPLHLAESWDNVGLLLGDPAAPVERVLICLTLTEDVAQEALATSTQVIVSHHPVLFKPVQRLTPATAEGRTLLPLLRAGVAVYSAHTAYDNAPGGINDQLAARLGLVDVVPLRRLPEGPRCKIVVFVPDSDLSRVSDALFSAGAGIIGQYEQCSFRLAGTGTFFGTADTNPTVGVKGRREEVSEWRLEVVCPAGQVGAVVAAMRRAHSYEEPAFDVYPLERLPGAHGVGRRGHLPVPMAPADFVRLVASKLGVGQVEWVAGNKPVSEVAIVCGAGGSLLADVVAAGVDAFLTGEMRFHDQLAARAHGLTLALPGHFATERLGMERLAEQLRDLLPGLAVSASMAEVPPTSWLACAR